MKKIFSLLFLCLAIGFGFASPLNSSDIKNVDTFIHLVKTGDVNQLKKMVDYPLARRYPIPSVKNQAEFVRRYSQIFDDSLVNMIVNSSPEKNWDEMGWRGIMLDDGIIWLDFGGDLKAVNYMSKFEAEERKRLIQKIKDEIYPSLSNILRPILVMETKKFRVRIDRTTNGNLRYASWNINTPMSQKPELVIDSGRVVYEGSSGNHTYYFKRGNYSYNCSINIIGKTDTPAFLEVYHNGKQILDQPANLVD